MKRLLFALAVLSVVSLVGCTCRKSATSAGSATPPASGAARNPDAEKAAVAAADSWLKLIDDGKYDESWKESGEPFQKAVDQATWAKQLTGVREPLGKLVSRSVKSSQYATSLPDAPDGEYVVIQYDTGFEKKKAAVETVTPMKGSDGTWRVSGYFIK